MTVQVKVYDFLKIASNCGMTAEVNDVLTVIATKYHYGISHLSETKYTDLLHQYVIDGYSIRELGSLYDCTPQCIHRVLQRCARNIRRHLATADHPFNLTNIEII